MKVISGFQTGADIAGVKAAKDAGLATGGYMPHGFLTESGKRPEYRTVYGAEQTSTPNYNHRTLKNVMASDCTIIFDSARGPGSRLTKSLCQKNGKPFLYLTSLRASEEEVVTEIVSFIQEQNPVVLNIAGNRESQANGTQRRVYRVMARVFGELKGV